MPLPAARSDLQLDQFLCFAVYSTNLAFNRVYRPLLEKLGLTYVQYIVLVTLWQTDDQFVGVLGAQLFLASNTLTPVLKRLEALGFVTRSRDTVDERQVRVRLTAAGRALKAEAVDIPACIMTASGAQGPRSREGARFRVAASRPVARSTRFRSACGRGELAGGRGPSSATAEPVESEHR